MYHLNALPLVGLKTKVESWKAREKQGWKARRRGRDRANAVDHGGEQLLKIHDIVIEAPFGYLLLCHKVLQKSFGKVTMLSWTE